MIIDFVNNQPEAVRYSVFSDRTGECLDDGLFIFYADDEKGIIRHFLQDENGQHYLVDPLTKRRFKKGSFARYTVDGKVLYELEGGGETDREPEIAWEEIKRVIKIRPKPQAEPR